MIFKTFNNPIPIITSPINSPIFKILEFQNNPLRFDFLSYYSSFSLIAIPRNIFIEPSNSRAGQFLSAIDSTNIPPRNLYLISASESSLFIFLLIIQAFLYRSFVTLTRPMRNCVEQVYCRFCCIAKGASNCVKVDHPHGARTDAYPY